MPFAIGFFLGIGASSTTNPVPPPVGDDVALLTEDGFYVLLEDDGKILLEAAHSAVLTEDGFHILLEDDSLILFE